MKNQTKLPDGFIISRRGIIPISDFNSEEDYPPQIDEILVCKKWLEEYTESYSKICKSYGSYSLKHKVEDWAESYVSNGALIYAVFSRGYQIKVIEKGPNALFGIKLLTPEEEWKHIRPAGFSNWLFSRKNEDSIIGDIARDAVNDDMWPRKASNFIDFWKYLISVNVSDRYLEILCEAWFSYSGEKAPMPDDTVYANCEVFYDGECDIIQYGENYPDAPDGFTYIYVLFDRNERYT